MNKTLILNPRIYQFGIPLLLLASLAFLIKSPLFNTSSSALNLGLTADLVFTVPLIYFLLIRKTSIPKTTVVPVFILGLVLGSLLLPEQNQNYLNLVKTWFLPLVELTALTFVIFNIRKAKRAMAAKGISDFFTKLKFAVTEMMPPKVATLFATELAVFYYALIRWRSPKLKANEFTYHKNTGTMALLLGLLMAVIIETVVFHILLKNWSLTAAWILTGLSIYSGFQVLGFAKSLGQRPINVGNGKLFLPYGILAETHVNLSQIERIETLAWNHKKNEDTVILSPLGEIDSYNIILHLKEEQSLSGFYGRAKTFKSLGINVDEREAFLKAVGFK